MNIHGIEFEVKWEEFKPYSSFFIPCLDWEAARDVIYHECEEHGVPAVVRFSVEDGIRGVRVWRVKEATPESQPPAAPPPEVSD
jgi:hypothetical protein